MIRSSGKMTLTISRDSYIDLINLYEIIPKIIETQQEYEHFLAVTENLLSKRKNRSQTENDLLMLLVKLIRDYEEKTYSLQDWIKTEPHEFLQHLIEARELKQVDLVGVISPSRGVVSAIVNGKRQISKAQAKKLGEFFNVSPAEFI
jgi:HTH-type transcriptional regulator / antitoxin HigA